MKIIIHELKQGRISLCVWTLSIGLLMAVCIFLFPEMKNEADTVGDMFSSMGSFSEAFGMDQISFGTLTGFYAVECGNVLGLGGAFFAALCGISSLAKEEKEHTAEFLFTHPVSRSATAAGKLSAVFLEIFFMNAVILLLSFSSIHAIGEKLPAEELLLLHLAYLLLQFEIAAVCFGISAFIRRSGLGVGLGLAAILYFLNIIANISEKAEFLRYFTPFAYADGTDIVTDVSLDVPLVIWGISCGSVIALTGFLWHRSKDIL